MINIKEEKLISIKEISRQLPNRPCTRTIYRWMSKGTADGRKLDSVRIGGRRFTSQEALQRFARPVATFGSRAPYSSDQLDAMGF